MANTTYTLAEFVAGLDTAVVPMAVFDRIKRQALDVIGVALAGSTQPAGTIAARFARRQGAVAEATVWGTDLRTSAAEAAFANGVAAHAADFDDMWMPGSHPTAPTFPATLALAESLRKSGRDVLLAQLAAYEVMGRLHSTVIGRAGWHPTGVFGTFGAAAAGARLLDLSVHQTVMAFGIASSITAGIDAHEGTMTKPFHAGHAARGGLVAALLAADGFTADDSVFDAGHSFFDAFYRDLPVQTWRLTAGLGDTYYVLQPGVGIKMLPAGYYMHQGFEAALHIVLEHDLQPADVESVEIGVRTSPSRFDRSTIRSGLEGKFSLQYMAAMAIVYRRLDVDLFTDEVAFSEPVQHILGLARCKVDRTIAENQDITDNPVRIRCRDGREYSARVPLPKSHWRYPLERAEWIGKFRANAARVLNAAAADDLVVAFDHLEDVADVRSIGALLALSPALMPASGGRSGH